MRGAAEARRLPGSCLDGEPRPAAPAISRPCCATSSGNDPETYRQLLTPEYSGTSGVASTGWTGAILYTFLSPSRRGTSPAAPSASASGQVRAEMLARVNAAAYQRAPASPCASTPSSTRRPSATPRTCWRATTSPTRAPRGRRCASGPAPPATTGGRSARTSRRGSSPSTRSWRPGCRAPPPAQHPRSRLHRPGSLAIGKVDGDAVARVQVSGSGRGLPAPRP